MEILIGKIVALVALVTTTKSIHRVQSGPVWAHAVAKRS